MSFVATGYSLIQGGVGGGMPAFQWNSPLTESKVECFHWRDELHYMPNTRQRHRSSSIPTGRDTKDAFMGWGGAEMQNKDIWRCSRQKSLPVSDKK